MKNNHYKKITLILGAIIIILILGISFCFYLKTQSNSTPGSSTEFYINNQLGFSLNYPNSLNPTQEINNIITFKASEDEPWMISVSSEQIDSASTQEWLNKQMRGNTSTQTAQPILWIHNTALITENIRTDTEGNNPIYQKTIKAILVENGRLYKISSRNQSQTNEPPSIDSDFLNVITSFQSL